MTPQPYTQNPVHTVSPDKNPNPQRISLETLAFHRDTTELWTKHHHQLSDLMTEIADSGHMVSVFTIRFEGRKHCLQFLFCIEAQDIIHSIDRAAHFEQFREHPGWKPVFVDSNWSAIALLLDELALHIAHYTGRTHQGKAHVIWRLSDPDGYSSLCGHISSVSFHRSPHKKTRRSKKHPMLKRT